jgi:hypothetical protein
MEDVLDLSVEPYDPERPKVNFDETNKQQQACLLWAETCGKIRCG